MVRFCDTLGELLLLHDASISHHAFHKQRDSAKEVTCVVESLVYCGRVRSHRYATGLRCSRCAFCKEATLQLHTIVPKGYEAYGTLRLKALCVNSKGFVELTSSHCFRKMKNFEVSMLR